MNVLLAQAGDTPINWGWIPDHLDDIWDKTLSHLQLTLISVGIGLAISMMLAVLASRNRRLYGPITSVTGVLYTVPSIALFPLLIPFTGLRDRTAVIALVMYTLLILFRNTVAGLDGVPEDVRESALGMGYTRNRLFLEIELPLALPVIIAGLRIATVTTVGLATIAALIGTDSLGFFIFDGFQSNMFVPKLVVGALMPMVLAMVLDGLLLVAERMLTPWSRRAGSL